MAKRQKTKLILDTNWYVSATINRKSRRKLYELLKNEKLIIIYAYELLEEYNRVIHREKFNKIIAPNQIERFIRLVITKLAKVDITTSVEKSRDVKDNYLLALAIDSRADYLVTGDPDLLDLKQIEDTQIINMADFLVRTSI
ncbi:MAG: putative toxin-antitoxin system toxin component, PIN family [Saprospiraceae bacterium]|nr:putative toxin-antitoxin system toxin component, PIN family [Saprospiraceae bacterium]